VALFGVDPLGDVALFGVDPLGDVALFGVDPLGDVALFSLLLSCPFPALLLSCPFPALLLSCPFPALLLSSDEVGETKVKELPNANAWLFDGIAVTTASIRIPAKAKGEIITIGLCTYDSI
jgi:hypothetical protein